MPGPAQVRRVVLGTRSAGGGVAAVALPEFLPAMSIAPSVVYGNGQMVSTYSGPAMRVVRASDSATLDIPNASRALDVSSIPAFTSGTTMAVDTWYDQSVAAGGNAVQATASARPGFRLGNVINGQYPWTNETDTANAGLNLPSIVTQRNNCTILAVICNPTGGAVSGNGYAIATLGTNATYTNNLNLVYGGANVSKIAHVANGIGSADQFAPNLGNLQVIALRGDQTKSGSADAAGMTNDETTLFGEDGTVAASTMTGGGIGKAAALYPKSLGSHYLFFAVYPGVLTLNDVDNFRRWAASRFGTSINTSKLPIMATDGDSITAGTISSQHLGRTLQFQAQRLLSNQFMWSTGAIAGQGLASMYGNRTQTFPLQYNATRAANYLYAACGSNDISTWVDNETTLWTSYMLPYIQAAQAYGFSKVLVGTIIPRNWTSTGGGTPTQKETRRKAFNQILRENAVTYGFTVVDYDTVSGLLNDITTGTVISGAFIDGIHPNDVGYAVMAPVLVAAMATAGIASATPTLGPVQLSTITLTPSVSASGKIIGATTGSTLVLTGGPSGLTIDSAARTWSWSGSGEGSSNITITETLAGATGSPRATVSYLVSGAFLRDNMTGTAGTALTAHSPDAGGAWSTQSGSSPATASMLDGNGAVYSNTTSGIYRNAAIAPSTDYYVEGVLKKLTTITGDTVGINARASSGSNNYYSVRWLEASSGWALYAVNGGTSTQLGTTYSDTFADGQSKTVRITARDWRVKVSIDGVDIPALSGTTVTNFGTTGFAGIRGTTVQSASTGIHIDSIIGNF